MREKKPVKEERKSVLFLAEASRHSIGKLINNTQTWGEELYPKIL